MPLPLVTSLPTSYFFLRGWHGERSTWNLFLALFYLIGGIIWFVFPKSVKSKNALGVQFVSVDDEKIKWSSGIFTKPNELLLADIDSYKRYVGEVHFTTTHGELVKLPIHMIEDKEKHEEFLRIMRVGFGHEASLMGVQNDKA